MIILMSFFLSSLICSISCFILIINSLLFYLFLREFCLSQSCLCGFFRILPMSHLHCSSFPLRKDFSALPQSFPALNAKSSPSFPTLDKNTFAVFLPTPGSSTSFSMSGGTFPSYISTSFLAHSTTYLALF